MLELEAPAVRNLALVLAGFDPERMPVNLWAPVYTEVAIEVLDHRNSVQARRFAGLEPTTHGICSESFDALVRTLVRLQDQVAAEGRARPIEDRLLSLRVAPHPPIGSFGSCSRRSAWLEEA